MKPEELQAIRERWGKVTQSEWFWEEGTPHIRAKWYKDRNPIIATVVIPEWHENTGMGSLEASRNANAISHANEDVSKLLDEISRLREALRIVAEEDYDKHPSTGPLTDHTAWKWLVSIARKALEGESNG